MCEHDYDDVPFLLLLCIRYKSQIRGLFSAITCPSSIGPIIAQGGFQEKLFLCTDAVCSFQLLCSLSML